MKSFSIITDSPADCNVPLDSDSQGHVDGGAEGDSRHGVEDVDIELGQDDGVGEHLIDNTEGGVGMDRYIEHDIPKISNI